MTNDEDIIGQSGEEARLPDVTYHPGANKLDAFDWLKEISDDTNENEIIEVRFKNTRKGFFKNVNALRFEIGDIVAVEASPGHDIGRVSMTGHLVYEQLKKLKGYLSADDFKKVYRKAKTVDIQKWEEAQKLEGPTMLRTRKIAEELNLNMKIGDVEYQGDKTKAIFYYIADERVDFRQLIKVLAEEFKIRVEMRQIGARQEAGRIGGIGPCGRKLCCSTHVTNFMSVTTTHAKYQELSLNPQKLAGQCSKLKCCLNFEFDCYVDAQKDFPPRDIPLEAMDCTVYFQKLDVHKGIYWYSADPNSAADPIAISVERVKEIQEINRKGEKVAKLLTDDSQWQSSPASNDLLKDNSLTRFDKPEEKKNHHRHNRRSKKKNRRFNEIKSE
jgi:cell fate regulator YaaT (PSP1 superfamily)